MIRTELNPGDTVDIDVSVEHAAYVKMRPEWEKCRDAVSGGIEIKAKGTVYLPRLSHRQTDDDYRDYLNRAYWYAATGRTVASFLGLIMRKPPRVRLESIEQGDVADAASKRAEDVLDNATSDGRSYQDLASQVAYETMVLNRVGVLEDYEPGNLDEEGRLIPRTQLETEQLGQKSHTAVYRAEDIINWTEEEVHGRTTPTLFVLRERRDDPESPNPLAPGKVDLYRLLYLHESDTGAVTYRQALLSRVKGKTGTGEKGKAQFLVEESYTPVVMGESLDWIPFWIITDHGVDYGDPRPPAVYDMVEVNLAHFRNSADYERELHNVSIKTAVFPGWNKDEDGDPALGGALASPPDQKPLILEAHGASPLKEEMKAKEQRMATLGAQMLMHRGRYVESAETAEIHARGEASPIASLANKVGEALSQVFALKLLWSGLGDVVPAVELNTDFDERRFSAGEIKSLLELRQSGDYSYEAFFHALNQMELYPRDWTMAQEIDAILDGRERIEGGLTGGAIEDVMTAMVALETRIQEVEERTR